MAFNLLILAAGYATRMGALSERRAKPLLEVGGRPMMDWVVERFSGIDGCGRIVVVSNSRFIDDFREWGRRQRAPDLALIENGSLRPADKLGAIGDMHFGIEAGRLWDRDLVVVGGDNLFELPPRGFVEFSRDKPAVIGTYDVGSTEEVKRFASIGSDADGRITAFEEKPLSPAGTVAGIALYALRRDVLPLVAEYLDEGNSRDQAGHLIAWLRHRVPTFACPISGQWFDVGSAESLAEADRVFSALPDRDSGCVAEGSRT